MLNLLIIFLSTYLIGRCYNYMRKILKKPNPLIYNIYVYCIKKNQLKIFNFIYVNLQFYLFKFCVVACN